MKLESPSPNAGCPGFQLPSDSRRHSAMLIVHRAAPPSGSSSSHASTTAVIPRNSRAPLHYREPGGHASQRTSAAEARQAIRRSRCGPHRACERVHRKRASDSREDVVGDRDEIAATLKPPQRTNGCAFRVSCQSFADTCAHDRPRRFRKRQRGRNRPSPRA
jgi:hypothetical protein